VPPPSRELLLNTKYFTTKSALATIDSREKNTKPNILGKGLEVMTPTTVTNAARTLAKRRAKKYTHDELSNMSKDAVRTKIERFGSDWAAKVQRGERLVPLTNMSPLTPRSSEGEEV